MKNIITVLILLIGVHLNAQGVSICNVRILSISASGSIGYSQEGEEQGFDFSKICVTVVGTANLCDENGQVIGGQLTLTLQSQGCNSERLADEGMSMDNLFMPLELLGDAPTFEGQDIALVFPNPSKGLFTLKTKKDNLERKISLISLVDGRPLKNAVIQKSDKGYVIDLSAYPDGMYLVTYEEDNQKFSQKIIKN
ncbi:T9SS type A sorting domain-containing protein [Psychroserpens sp. XS_ASV72]|uniref:T9SS type A sorting domain-containing protein n=1 Tax=Psychroserpens sp. XS_ASV72 TaxID=3241293 RepID=UPI003516B741